MKPSLKTLKKWAPHKLTVVSGILVVLAFPPWNLWPLLWICLVPWFAAIHQAKTPKAAMREGFWLNYFMSLGGFYWVAYVLEEFGNIPRVLSILGLQLFCFVGQPQFWVMAPLLKFIEPGVTRLNTHPWKKSGVACLLALLYAGIDWTLPKLFKDTLGHALYLAPHLRQLADLGGATILTFLVYLVNDSIWNFYSEWRRLKKWRLSPQLGVTLLFVLAGTGYGVVRQNQINHLVESSTHGFQAAAIQGNIGDFDKLAAERGLVGAAFKVLDVFTSMSDEALHMTPQPDVVIWPETSYPSTFRNPHSSTEISLDLQIESYREKLGVPLLFGGYDHSNNKDYNAFFYLTPQGKLEIYQKNILLLFGEYIPGAEQFDFLKDAFPQVGNFGRGRGPSVLNFTSEHPGVGTVRTGPVICYEVLFPSYVIDAANQGSQVILNITNDSWFGNWGEPQLHLALSTFRSIETRLPMIRSTNTGFTALILPDGSVSKKTSLNTAEILNVHVPTTDPIPTLMKKWGDWFGPFALLLGLLGPLYLRKSRTASAQS